MFIRKRVEYFRDETCLMAFVRSSDPRSPAYETSLEIDERNEEVTGYCCTCPAFLNYDGMCKHCAALGLNFIKNKRSFEGWEDWQNHSSGALHKLFSCQEKVLNDKNKAGSVSLVPTFFEDQGLWAVEFHLQQGKKKSYLVKNISRFVNAIKQTNFVEYGRELAFVHDISMFDNQSKALLEVVLGIVEEKEMVDQAIKHRFPDILTNYITRRMELEDAQVVSFFNALKDVTFGIVHKGARSSVQTIASIEERDPDLQLEINRGDIGWEIKQKEKFRIISSGSQLFICKEFVRNTYNPKETIYHCGPEFAQNIQFLKCLCEDLDDGGAYVSEKELPIFCSRVLPQLQESVSVDVPPELEDFEVHPCKIKFYFDKTKNEVSVNACAVYGERAFVLFGELPDELAGADEQPFTSIRDYEVEEKAKELAQDYFRYDENVIAIDDQFELGRFIFEGLPKFFEIGRVYSNSAFSKLLIRDTPKVEVDASVAEGVLKLEFSSADLTKDEIADLLKCYRQKKKYHLLTSGALVNVEDLDFEELDDIAEDLDLSQKQISEGTVELPAYRAFYLESQKSIRHGDGFNEYLKFLRETENKKRNLPKTLTRILRPYQKEGVGWLDSRTDAGFGAILADEMGLGKSIQLIALLLSKQKEATAPSLIVCPSSLVYNWKSEFDRFAPNLKVATIAGSASERRSLTDEAFDSWNKKSGRTDVLITSYDLARIDVKNYCEREFFFLAIDEAQFIKNTNTQTTKAIKKMSAKHRLALTGTPIENRLSELWSIFDFLMPGILGSKTHFKTNFEKPISEGDENAQKRLQSLVGPFMLRRCKSEVLKDLPEKLESVVYSEMDKEQKSIYLALEKRLADRLQDAKKRKGAKNKKSVEKETSKVEVLAELTKLRQVCCDPRLLFADYKKKGAKLETILELIGSAQDAGEKVLVFSQFTTYLDLIEDELKAQKIDYYEITGKTPKKKRLELVNAFNVDNVPVFLISLKAGGTGLNLTGASVVIHADPWWNDAAEQQASDRAHRIGQTSVVNVQKVIAKDTIEERIVKLQEKKRKLSDDFVKSGSVSLSALSEQDLIELLQG